MGEQTIMDPPLVSAFLCQLFETQPIKHITSEAAGRSMCARYIFLEWREDHGIALKIAQRVPTRIV